MDPLLLGVLEDLIPCLMSFSVEDYEVKDPKVQKRIDKLKRSIDEMKRLIDELERRLIDKRKRKILLLIEDSCFNAAKKRILGPDEQESPGFVSLKMKKNIEMQYSFDREDVFKSSCYRNAGDRLWNSLWKELCRKESLSRKESLRPVPQFSILQNHLLRALGEYPQNRCKVLNESKLHPCVNKEKQMNTTGNKFSLDNNKPCVILNTDLMEPSQRHGNKIISQLQDNSTGCNLNKHKHKETMPRYPMFQHKRKEIAQLVSFVVAVSIMFLGLFSDMWIQPLHKERGPVSIWASLLGLFGFMVFVWAVAITILVGVPFSRMQSSVLIFWAILMHLKSAGSISAVFVPMLGIIFLVVFARGKV